ncbi:MAG TPA: HEAT repeat domain-containing protein, partial [Gemmataceae bacterium]|nr:HEAT repeat domain-containing protein [Gemmataceae bacterium]
QIKDRQASIALAKRAVFDLSRDVRTRAIEALQNRPRDEYRWVFLKALRYPWAPAARHASEALIALRDYQAVPLLISLLDKPNPSAPFRVGKRHMVREMVRTNHLANCLLCHPPSVTYRDPVPGVVPAVTWAFPVPGRTQANQLTSSINSLTGKLTSTGTTIQTGCHNYSATSSTSAVMVRTNQGNILVQKTITVVRNGAGRPILVTSPQLRMTKAPTPTNQLQRNGRKPTFVRLPLLVRGDITYLRQDFSVLQPVAQPVGPSPLDMRFDYLVRTRVITPLEARLISEGLDNQHYEQRQAVIMTLRELTGRDQGQSTLAWRQLVPHADAEARAMQLVDEAVAAKPGERHRVLLELRDGKGLAYTDALAKTIAKLHGDARADARDLLAYRLTRMAPATLQAKLHDDDAEVRRAAARACALKRAIDQVPDLIELLDDPDPAVVQAAHQALKELSGRDYGPNSPEDHLQAVSAWKGWSDKQGRLGDAMTDD